MSATRGGVAAPPTSFGDRQTDLPEVQFVRTPRAATGFNHRLLVLLGDGPRPPGWDSDPRAEAELSPA